jgi:branched-subunit amino acid ABC-type transport system permease component
MNMLPQVLVNGIVTGSVYALIAVGFALSFGVLKRVNFAHGVTFVVGGYVGYILIGKFDFSFLAGAFGALAFGCVVGFITERIAFRPFQNSQPLTTLVSSLALATVIANILTLAFGEDVKSFRSGLSRRIVLFAFGPSITEVQLTIVILCFIVGLSLFLTLAKTAFGRRGLAVSDAPEAAATWGIDGSRASLWVFMLSTALASFAGYLAAFDLDVDPHLGTSSLFKGFAANVIFGVGSLGGSVLGGMMLGLLENLITAYVSSRYQAASTLAVLMTLLLFRPRGILNLRTGRFW